MELLNNTVFQGFSGTVIALLMGYVGKLLVTPNERIKQLNDIIIQHTDLIQKLTEQVADAISNNQLLQLRIKELEHTVQVLESENLFLKTFKRDIEKSNEYNERKHS